MYKPEAPKISFKKQKEAVEDEKMYITITDAIRTMNARGSTSTW